MVVLLRLLTKLNVATLRLVENQINVSRLLYYSIYPTVVLWCCGSYLYTVQISQEFCFYVK